MELSCLGAPSLVVEGALALRPDQLGFKVKLIITSQETLGKLVHCSEPQFSVYSVSTSHSYLPLCWALTLSMPLVPAWKRRITTAYAQAGGEK